MQLWVLLWAAEFLFSDAAHNGWILGVPLLVEVLISPWSFRGGPVFPYRLLLLPALGYALATVLLLGAPTFPSTPLVRFVGGFALFYAVIFLPGWLLLGPVTAMLALFFAAVARFLRWLTRAA